MGNFLFGLLFNWEVLSSLFSNILTGVLSRVSDNLLTGIWVGIYVRHLIKVSKKDLERHNKILIIQSEINEKLEEILNKNTKITEENRLVIKENQGKLKNFHKF